MATMIPGSAQTFEELKWRFVTFHGEPIEETERLRAFARRYAERWMKKHGSPPHMHHPFPNPWEPTFVIEYAGPRGFISEWSRELQSAGQA